MVFFSFCFVFVFLFPLKPRPFVQSFFDILRNMCPDSHTQLHNNTTVYCVLFFFFRLSSFLGDVAFFEYFVPSFIAKENSERISL